MPVKNATYQQRRTQRRKSRDVLNRPFPSRIKLDCRNSNTYEVNSPVVKKHRTKNLMTFWVLVSHIQSPDQFNTSFRSNVNFVSYLGIVFTPWRSETHIRIARKALTTDVETPAQTIIWNLVWSATRSTQCLDARARGILWIIEVNKLTALPYTIISNAKRRVKYWKFTSKTFAMRTCPHYYNGEMSQISVEISTWRAKILPATGIRTNFSVAFEKISLAMVV